MTEPAAVRSPAETTVTADAALHLGLGLAAVAATGWLLTTAWGFSWRLPAAACAIYAPIALIAVGQVRAHHPHPCFGLANLVTTVRAAMTCLLAGLIADAASVPLERQADFAWALVALASAAIVLDGLDGFLARRLGLSSAFGARYDMEVDAVLILLLSLAALSFGKAGAWVILSGGLRYAFVAAGWRWPFLDAALPPSYRRKAVCVVQAGALCLLLSPLIQPPLSSWLAAGALALLVYSFAVDVAWLVARRDRPATALA